jgi:hypothetical protein
MGDETKLEYDTKNYSMLNKIRICFDNFVLIVERRSLNILSYSNFVSSYSNSLPSYYKSFFTKQRTLILKIKSEYDV